MWRAAFGEMKSDLLVQRVLWPRCWLGNDLAQLILCVCVRHSENVFVCIYPYAYASWFPPSVCLWYRDHANQCCLGLAVKDSHLDAALIISVVIFTEWFGFAVSVRAGFVCECVRGSGSSSVALNLLSSFSSSFWLMIFQSAVSGQHNPTTKYSQRGGMGESNRRTWVEQKTKKERKPLRGRRDREKQIGLFEAL